MDAYWAVKLGGLLFPFRRFIIKAELDRREREMRNGK